MRAPLALFGLATALAFPILGSATNLTYDFTNDVPKNSTGVSVGATQTFTDTNKDATTVTASVDPGIYGFTLYEKKAGGDENGLGVHPGSDNEINAYLPGIELNLSNLLALDPTSISIALNSVQSGEVGVVTYADPTWSLSSFLNNKSNSTPPSFDIKNENSYQLNLTDLAADGGDIWVTAQSGNVLIADVTATTATPEPADAGLIGLGLLLAGSLIRRAKKA